MDTLLEGIGVLLRDAGTPPHVIAYLDAGTGSLIFQWAVAGLLGGVFVLKTSWRRIASFFSRAPRKEDGQM